MAISNRASGIKTIEGLAKAISIDAAETKNVVANLNFKKQQTKEFPMAIQGNKMSVRSVNFAEVDAPIRLGKRNSLIGGRAMVSKNLNAKQATAMHHFKSFAAAETHSRKACQASGGSLLYEQDKSEMDRMLDFLGDLGVSIENPLKKNRKLEKDARGARSRKARDRGFDVPMVMNNSINLNVMIPAEALFRPESKIIKSGMTIIDKVQLGEGNVGCRGLDKSHNRAISYIAGEMGFLYTKLSSRGELALYASSGKKPGSEKDFGHGPRIVPNGSIALLGAARKHVERSGQAVTQREEGRFNIGRKPRYPTMGSSASRRARRVAAGKADVTAEPMTPQQVLDLLK